jgi:hypothetical protein
VDGKVQDTAVDNSPEAIMNRRFPQKVRVGDLVGLPMLDDNDVTLGRVQRVVRSPEGKIKLIVNYSKWFGWFGRPVAVPVEAVAILARQIASLDMPPAEYEAAPTWTEGKDMPIPDGDIIRIAVTRRQGAGLGHRRSLIAPAISSFRRGTERRRRAMPCRYRGRA